MNEVSSPKMKPSLFNLVVASLTVAVFPVAAQEIPPGGMFRTCAWCGDFTLIARGHGLWMQVPELRSPGEIGKEFRIAPTPFPGGKESTSDCSCQPDDGLVSPDARWVALSQKVCVGFAVGFVLKRDEKKGFIPLPKLVSEMGWDKYFEENPDQVAKRGEMSGITSLVEKSMCDLIAWEPDSSGVWFSLRGGDRRTEGIRDWYFLWETKTGQVVVPERVKIINRFAATRWNPDPDRKLLSKEAIAAEVQHYVFLADLKQRLADPDRLLKRETLEQEARAHFDLLRKADRGAAPKGVRASEARMIVDRNHPFLASQKAGAVARLEPPP